MKEEENSPGSGGQEVSRAQRRRTGGNMRIRCQGDAYNDHRGHPVLIYRFMSSPIIGRSLSFYLPLGSPELD
jgi:hypothetical protein